jgi:hypothetical protein
MIRRLPLLLAAAALALSAQEPSLGVRAHGLFPMGDLRDLTNGQVGLGLAAFVDIPVGRGLVFRPVVGAQHLPKGDTLGLAGTKTRVTSVDLMVDTIWFPGEDPERGPYLIGSAGGQQWRLSATGASPSTVSYTRLGLAAGLGFQASPRLAFEAKGVWSPVAPGITATGLTLGAAYRF